MFLLLPTSSLEHSSERGRITHNIHIHTRTAAAPSSKDDEYKERYNLLELLLGCPVHTCSGNKAVLASRLLTCSSSSSP